MDYNYAVEMLVKGVKKQTGMSARELRDVCEHGADYGVPGFTYYNETCGFYKKYKEEIWEIAAEDADQMGYKGVMDMVQHFGCMNGGEVSDPDLFENCMAWYALEWVARYLNPDY